MLSIILSSDPKTQPFAKKVTKKRENQANEGISRRSAIITNLNSS